MRSRISTNLKEKIRQKILKALKSQDPRERKRKSGLIKKKLSNSKEYKAAKVVMFYLSKGEEVQTDEMIKAALEEGKRAIVPVTVTKERRLICSEIEDLNDLVLGSHGVRRPREEKIKEISTDELDLVIVPGVAFDESQNRLGRGAGYYDRFLKGIPKNVPKVGLAFDFQILKRLPFLSHDIPVTKLITA